MATGVVSGKVVSATWLVGYVCVAVGQSVNDAHLLNLQFLEEDSPTLTETKATQSNMLASAMVSQRDVSVLFDDSHIIGVSIPHAP